MAQLLLITICLPMLGAGVMWALAPLGRNAVRSGALAITLATLVLAIALVAQFPANGIGDESFAVAHGRQAAPQFDVRFSVGLDGIGIWMFGLSALLMVSAVLISWDAIKDRAPLFYAMLLLLESGCLGVFAARDIILFYVFFEFTLIPLFFLIGIWGSEERRYAATKFFLFTLAGSLLTFIGLLSIVVWDYTQSGGESMRFSIPALTASLQNAGEAMPVTLQCWIFLALFAGFAVKVPLFPVHTWLPLAHVQAPAAGSVFLAGILLKIGTYGFLRFNIPMLPEATVIFMPFLLWLAAAGIVYGALAALAQGDMKRLIAYSSVSHLGYCVLGLFALNRLGVQGGALQMINHGISTGGLFAIIGMMYDRYHTRDIRNLGGLARQTPWLAFFMLVFTFSSIGLPGLNGFAGEFLVLAGMFQRAFAEAPSQWAGHYQLVTLLALSGVVLGAWYMLWLVQRVFFGPVNEPKDAHDVDDMNWREFAALAPLVVFVLWIGLQPNFFLQRMAPALQRTTAAAERRLQMDLDAEALEITQTDHRRQPDTLLDTPQLTDNPTVSVSVSPLGPPETPSLPIDAALQPTSLETTPFPLLPTIRMVDTKSLIALQPEILLILAASAIYVVGAFLRPSRQLWTNISCAVYVAAAGIILVHEWPNLSVRLITPISVDMLGLLLRLLALLGGILFTLMVSGTMNRRLPSEYLGTVMLAVSGVMLSSRANDLVMLFLSLELVSIPSYILLFIGRDGRPAAEATAKYFFLSILSSALMLYGFSFLYGAAGTTVLVGEPGQRSIEAALAGSDSALITLAMTLIMAGLGFKIAAAPFHFYAPDVYQGASNSVAALLAVAPKVAGMAALIRIGSVLPLADSHWKLVIIIAILTMTIGNVGALWQKNLRRMLAYSSIAHAGYMLIGLAVVLASDAASPSVSGSAAIVFYLATYLIASLGAFGVAVWLGSEQHQVSGIDELAGLGKTKPATAVAMAMMMFSLAGIPPLAGFWGKLSLFTSSVSVSLTSESGSSVQQWFVVLAVAGAINAAIAAAYYLRVVGVMYFRSPGQRMPQCEGGTGAGASVAICAALVALLGFAPGLLLGPASFASPQQPIEETRAAEVEAPPQTFALMGSEATEMKRHIDSTPENCGESRAS